MDSWSYRAPQCQNFRTLHQDVDDGFFDTICDDGAPQSNKQYTDKKEEHFKEEKMVIKQEIETSPQYGYVQEQPILTEIAIKQEPETPHLKSHRRRSMSVHVMQTVKDKTKVGGAPEYNLNKNNILSIKDFKTSEKQFSRVRYNGKSSSVSSLQNNPHMNVRYVSVSEEIHRMQNRTPERFHSHPKNFVNPTIRQKPLHLQVTVPQSPALLSKTRIRPVTVLSQKEIEDLQYEEIKKHKIKANPISNAVLYGSSHLPAVQRRPKTRPEPFNLTEIKKRTVELQENKFTFAARPVPKTVLNKPLEMIRNAIPPTVPISPKITKSKSRSMEHLSRMEVFLKPAPPKLTKCPLKMAKKFEGAVKNLDQVGHSGVPLSTKVALHPCKPAPFSFEERDKDRELKKNEKINKFLEEENKLREFRANPLPLCFSKKNRSLDSNSPKHKSNKENKENCTNGTTFKARPPLVLHKEPFIPAKSDKPLSEPGQIELTTVKRARERDAFNQKIKEKEEYREMMRKMKEEERKIEEEKQVALLRTQLVHKAAPVRHYNPVHVHASEIPLTFPKSPKFHNKH